MNQEKQADILNNQAVFKTFEDRTENFKYWTERYQRNESFAVPEHRSMGGSGFATTDKDNWRDMLDARQTELKYTTNEQDKERLTLLLNAETAACRSSNHKAREEFGKLLQYDKDRNHPLADTSRDLKKEPYTKAEMHDWMNRDGRKQQTHEQHHLTHGKSWDGPRANVEQETRVISSPDWFIAPSVKQNQADRQVNEIQGMTLDKSRILAHRQQKEEDRGLER